MKYKGQALVEKNSTVVKIKKQGTVLEFVVSPLPLGWYPKMRAIGLTNYPAAKKIALMDKNNNVVRNKSTGRAETVEVKDDPEYQSQVALISQRVRTLQLAAHLRDDPNVEWESKQPENNNLKEWQDYADSLFKELEQSSLTEEEVAEILQAGENSACVLDIEKVADDLFLSPTVD